MKTLHCQLERKNYHTEKVITVKTEKGDVVDHIPHLLAQALVPEMVLENTAFAEAVVTDEPRSTLEGK